MFWRLVLYQLALVQGTQAEGVDKVLLPYWYGCKLNYCTITFVHVSV